MRSLKPRSPAADPLRSAIEKLRELYGPAKLRSPSATFGMILWEVCAYLVDDDRREETFRRLVGRVGGDPRTLAAAPIAKIAEAIAGGGMRPIDRAAKVQRSAEIALALGPEGWNVIVRGDPAAAARLLKRFPNIGEPGAEKILLVAGRLKVLAPDSNALRVLRRLGFGKDEKDYGRTYRSVRESVAPLLPDDFGWLLEAHLLLRRHGQEICRRTKPHCDRCPLRTSCAAYRTGVFSGTF